VEETNETPIIEIAPYGKKGGVASLPNSMQEKVLYYIDQWRARQIDELADDGKGIPVLYVEGGVGAGKTRALLAPVLEILVQYPGIRVLWGRLDFADLRVSAMETFNEVAGGLIAGKNEQEHRYSIKSATSGEVEKQYGNLSKIFFRELKDLSGLGSQEFAIVVITEAHELSYRAYTDLKGRIRQKPYPLMLLMEGNPPNEGHWLDNICKRGAPEFDDDVTKISVSTYDNWDNLPFAYRKTLEKMPPAWRRKYVDGKVGFIPDGKAFYSGFSEEFHTGNFEYIKEKEIIRCMDFGFHHPAVAYMQFDSDNRLIVLRELMGTDITLERFLQYSLVPFEAAVFPNSRFSTYYDVAGKQKTDKADTDCIKILANFGITGFGRQSTYVKRQELIERLLSQTIKGLPAFMIDKKCRISIEGFLGGYHYPVVASGNAEKEEPYKDGYYEHCLSGDTKIRTLFGWHFIKDLVDKEFITYAYDTANKRLVPAKAHSCRKTQENVELWKLKFDEGELIATPDHLIMMRDGSYKQLKDLKINDELMPFYEKQRSYKGHIILNLNDGSIVDEHRYIYNWFNGNIRDGYHIHHKDSNPLNNNPYNLEQIEAKEHMRGVYEKMRKHPTVEAMKKGSLNPLTKVSREKMSRFMTARWEDGSHPLTKRTDKICHICNNVFSGNYKQKYCIKCKGRARNFRDKARLLKINHKVMSIEFYGFGDTYNLEVETHHNFPANGIMVHNCMNCIEYGIINLFTLSKSNNRGGSNYLPFKQRYSGGIYG